MKRIRSKPEFAVPRAVEELLAKFEYPDIDPDPLPFELGGGGGAPTIVVAAANSSDLEKAKSDYICAGVNDEQTLQAAVDQMEAEAVALGKFLGRLLLCSGVFEVSFNGSANVVDFSTFGGISVEGMGSEATIINVTDSFSGSAIERFAFNCDNDNIMVHKLSIQGGDGVSGATNGIIIGNHSTVRDCLFTIDGIGVRTTDGSTNVESNGFIRCDVGIQAWANDTRVTNNQMDGIDGTGIDINSVSGVVAAANFIHTDGIGVDITGLGSGNPLLFEGHIVAHNTIDSGQHGVRLTDSGQCLVVDNIISTPGDSADDTYDGIILVDDSVRNYLHGNKIIVPASGNAPRYGVNVSDADCDCNIVVGNDLGDPNDYGSDALNDAGTDTQPFWPADATYGDNFTECIPTSPSSPTSP